MATELSFGVLAKNRRRELGLTQDELARRVGCAPITIRKIEADDLRPSVQIAERMAMALNIPLGERAAFVKLARVEHTPAEEPKVTPMPAPEEIGSEDLSGRAIRGYALGERLGNGGMGAVYRAVQPLVEREVAIKIILPKYANHPDFIRRFEAEAQLVARLEHPHIVPLYDYWREPSVAYLVMRLLRGGSVHSLLRNGGTLPPATVLRIVEQIGSALGAAHRAGVVHRDLKPANVLLDEDNNAYLADFGIAKNLSNYSSETQGDMIIGSPDYISPEQIRSEYIRPQTDIYALGVMLYELFTGTVPFRGPTPFEVMHQHLSAPLPPLSANSSGLPSSLDEVIKRATAKDPLQRYEHVEDMLNDLRDALRNGASSGKAGSVYSQATLAPLKEKDNPYKGLRSFGEGDTQDFFGRESLLQQLLIRLGESGELSRFLTVVGPSGSGKSSVVKAGLIPALRRGALPGSEHWFIVEMMPGSHPLEELEAALLRVAVNPPASLIEQFQSDSRGLIRAVRRSLPEDPNIELVLVIDQFEEVFTLLQDEDERIRFLGLLVAAALDETSRIRIIVTVRADFIDRPLAYMDFGEILRQRMEIVLPLTSDEMESAIVSPAERVGLRLEHGLVPIMIRDLADQPGALPLLQYALTELFEKREANMLTKSAYHNIGGVLGALGRGAEEVYTGLDAECQEIARQLFLRLVTLGEGVEDTRRRVLISELENLQLSGTADLHNYSSSLKATLDVFGRARLLSFDRDPGTRGPTVEVAHEAILREWLRLRDWLNESRTLVRMQRQLAMAASEWEGAQRDESFLLTGTKLAQYEGWLENAPVALTEYERGFLEASHNACLEHEAQELTRQRRELETTRKLAETEKARAEEQTKSVKQLRQRAWYLVGVLILSLVIAGVAGLLAKQNGELATKNANIAATAKVAEENEKQNAQLAEERLIIAENERLTALAYQIASDPVGNSELAALLSIRVLKQHYDPKADVALVNSMPGLLTRFIIQPEPIATGVIAYSPDGSVIATGQVNNTVQLWDAKTGRFLRTLIQGASGSASLVTSIAFSPDGKFLLAGNTGGALREVELATGQTTRSYNPSDGTLGKYFGEYSPNGQWLLGFGSIRGGVLIWEATTGKRVFTFTCKGHAATATFSPDGDSVLIGCSNGNAYLWNIETKRQEQVYESSWAVISVAFSPDGQFVATGNINNQARLYKTENAVLIRTFDGHLNKIAHLTFSQDGKSLLTSSWDNTARLWDVESGVQKSIFTCQNGDPVLNAAFAPDGESILTGTASGDVRVWRIPQTKLALQDPTARYIANPSTQLSFNGKMMAFLDENASNNVSTIHFVDANTGNTFHTLEETAVRSFSLSPDGKTILLFQPSASGELRTRLVEIETGQVVVEYDNNIGVSPVSFSPDGSFVLFLEKNGTIQIWDRDTEQLGRFIGGAYFSLNAFAWSSDGKSLFVSPNTDFVQWLSLGTHSVIKLIGTSALNGQVITAVGISPDGHYAVLGQTDGAVKMWDIETNQQVRSFPGHLAEIRSIKYSPDGKYILTASNDRTIRLWDANTGELIRILSHKQYVFEAVFSNNGKFIISNGNDGTRIWDTDYHDTIQAACFLLLRDFTDAERQEYGITDTTPTCTGS